MQIDGLEKKLLCVWDLGSGDIPPWAIPVLHREVIFESIRGKRIALTRKRIDQILESAQSPYGSSEPSAAQLLAIYQNRALDYVELLSRSKSPLSCSTIKRIHALLFTGCADARKAKFRKRNFTINGNVETPVDHTQVGHLMKDYNSWLRSRQGLGAESALSEIIRFAAEGHLRLIYIHPFQDGNGRTARVFLNAILRRYRLPYVALPKVRNSNTVKAAIAEGLAGQMRAFCEVLEGLLYESCDLILGRQSRRRRNH